MRFKRYFDHEATAEEQKQIALFYHLNKDLINNLVMSNEGNVNDPNGKKVQLLAQKQSTGTAYAKAIGKFALAIAGGGASIWVMYAAIPSEPPVAMLAAGATYLFYTRAKKYGKEIVDLPDIRLTDLILGESFQNNSTTVGKKDLKVQARAKEPDVIQLRDNKEKTIPLQLESRPLINEDVNTSKEVLTSFFEKLKSFNDFILKTNNAIQWINDHIPFVDLSQLEALYLQKAPQIITIGVSEEQFGNMNFSINHPSLQIVKSERSAAGGLSLQVKIVDEGVEGPINSTLNYDYNDELNQFSGAISVTVSQVDHSNDGYQLQIGDFNPDYDLIIPQVTLNQGDAITLPNYMKQMVRLLLDGKPVISGKYGLIWTDADFGSIPTSGESLYYPDYTLTLHDSTNNKDVTFHLNLTLTNNAYSNLVGRTIEVGTNDVLQITFKADGTYDGKWKSNGEPYFSNHPYHWFMDFAYNWMENCPSLNRIIPLEGVINMHQASVTIPSYLLLEKGGTVRANSSYGCPDYSSYQPVK